MDVIVMSERDKRTLDWLIDQVGADAVERACAALSGERKPYVSNIAKVLGLHPPDSLMQSSRTTARAHLASLKDVLKGKQ